MSQSSKINSSKSLNQALALRREADAFGQIWPGPPSPETPMTTFTWQQLERQLADLSGSPSRAAITAPLVSALRKQSKWKPPEMVLREILCLAWTLMDESFLPGLLPGEDADMP